MRDPVPVTTSPAYRFALDALRRDLFVALIPGSHGGVRAIYSRRARLTGNAKRRAHSPHPQTRALLAIELMVWVRHEAADNGMVFK